MFIQGDVELPVKLEFDDDGMVDANGAAGDNLMISPSGLPNPGAKPKAPRVKKEKKEPGKEPNRVYTWSLELYSALHTFL